MITKLIRKRWIIITVVLIFAFLLILNQTSRPKVIINNKVVIPTIIPTVTDKPYKYWLEESHRGVPRLLFMEKSLNLVAGNEYYDILKQRIENDHLSAKIWFESRCNEFWIFDKPTDEFISIERHGYHQDGCPGDPNFAPRMDTFNIDKKTKEIFWLDVGRNRNIPYAEWAKTVSKE